MRISSAERSDGKGSVIRLHMYSKVDSFALAQPNLHTIQLAIFDPYIDTADIKRTLSPVFQDISLHQLQNGIGLVINISGNTYYRAQAYPDGTSNDILLALTETSKSNLKEKIQNETALAWAPEVEPVPTSDIERETVKRPSYNELKKNMELDVIVIDPGHGGDDVGATGYSGHYEKDIVMAIAKKLGHYINKYMPEIKVVYTRTSDYLVGTKKNSDISIMQSLIERGQIANRAKGDLFISIHANAAAANSAHGTEVYFLGLERSKTALKVMKRENNIVDIDQGESRLKITPQEMFIYELANSANITAGQKLAGMIRHQFKARANRRSRGVKQARFVVLYHASMPAVLVETGFVTNPEEEDFLTSDYGQSIIASAIFRAIRNYKQQFAKNQGYSDE